MMKVIFPTTLLGPLRNVLNHTKIPHRQALNQIDNLAVLLRQTTLVLSCVLCGDCAGYYMEIVFGIVLRLC